MENDNNKPVNRIKELRLQKGYTLADVASKMHVSEGTVQRWESGKTNNIKASKLKQLAHMFETSIPFLIGWSESDIPSGTNIVGNYKAPDAVIGMPNGGTCVVETKSIRDGSTQLDAIMLLLNKVQTDLDYMKNTYAELIASYSQLSADNQQMVLAFVDTLLSKQNKNPDTEE